MEQFTDKEILDEFIKRFDFTRETADDDYQREQISLRDFDGVYLGHIAFNFNKNGQFIDDLPDVKLDNPCGFQDEIDMMDYDTLIDALEYIVSILKIR